MNYACVLFIRVERHIHINGQNKNFILSFEIFLFELYYNNLLIGDYELQACFLYT